MLGKDPQEPYIQVSGRPWLSTEEPSGEGPGGRTGSCAETAEAARGVRSLGAVRALEVLPASARLHPGSGCRAGAQPAGREAPAEGAAGPWSGGFPLSDL